MTNDPGEDPDGEELPDGQLQLDNLSDIDDGRMAVIYVRGNNNSDPLVEYTEDNGYEYTDTNRDIITGETHTGGVGSAPEGGCDGGVVIRDADESHPAGIEHLIEFVSDRDVDDVVTASLAAFGGVDGASRVVERLQDEGTTVHLIEDNLVIEPGDDRAWSLLDAARRASNRVDTDASTQLVTEATGTSIEWTGGQPPRGFTVSDAGYLQRDEEDWETIRRAAKAIEEDELTEYRASQLTAVSRHALRTALGKYRDLYRVEEADPLRITDDGSDQ